MNISKIFRILQFVCAGICLLGLILLLAKAVDNAGISLISMVFSLLFGMLYRESLKKGE